MKVALVVALVVVAGCAVGSPPTASPAPAIATPTAIPTLAPTPRASLAATPVLTPEPTPTDGVCPSTATGEPAVPPDIAIAGADGVLVVGSLGSYTYCRTSADALPPKAENLDPVAVAADAIDVIASGDSSVSGYRSGYWAAVQWQADEIALGNAVFDPSVNQFTVTSPPSGDWMLALHVSFTSGDAATYYWHVTVP